MRTKDELEEQINVLNSAWKLLDERFTKAALTTLFDIKADVQDELDLRNGKVMRSLGNTELSDGCVEDVQASGLPNQPKPMVEGLPASDKQLSIEETAELVCINTLLGVGEYRAWNNKEIQVCLTILQQSTKDARHNSYRALQEYRMDTYGK